MFAASWAAESEPALIITYKNDASAEDKFDTSVLTAIEASAIEGVTGLSWGEVEAALRTQSPTAMRAVLWVFRKRGEPTLRFSHFDVPGWRKRLRARLDGDEVAEILHELRRNVPDEAEFEADVRTLTQLAEDPSDVRRTLEESGPKAEAEQRPEESPASS